MPKAPRLATVLARCDVLFPDRGEAEALTGISVEDQASAAAAADELVGRGAATVVLKLGDDGVLVADASGRVWLPMIAPDRVRDVTGSGDSLVAGYLYGRSSGAAPRRCATP